MTFGFVGGYHNSCGTCYLHLHFHLIDESSSWSKSHYINIISSRRVSVETIKNRNKSSGMSYKNMIYKCFNTLLFECLPPIQQKGDKLLVSILSSHVWACVCNMQAHCSTFTNETHKITAGTENCPCCLCTHLLNLHKIFTLISWSSLLKTEQTWNFQPQCQLHEI